VSSAPYYVADLVVGMELGVVTNTPATPDGLAMVDRAGDHEN
jgi:hypothetical protein